MKVVTRDWVFEHRTKAGAWTRVQIEALGLRWPPRQGWINKVVGKRLTDEGAARFEQGSRRGQELPLGPEEAEHIRSIVGGR